MLHTGGTVLREVNSDDGKNELIHSPVAIVCGDVTPKSLRERVCGKEAASSTLSFFRADHMMYPDHKSPNNG